VERLFEYARLRRTAEGIGVVSIDRTPGDPGGLALKLGEKARVSPEKLLALVRERAETQFSPTGVLRVSLSEEEAGRAIETARGLLLEIRAAD
ncbi:MAG TPA: hypothetical protein VGV38_07140, partial [Pyrinomonadaceae bacterium]|nr:hypothetical protein [Pyrinomonadaceae bacterium]